MSLKTKTEANQIWEPMAAHAVIAWRSSSDEIFHANTLREMADQLKLPFDQVATALLTTTPIDNLYIRYNDDVTRWRFTRKGLDSQDGSLLRHIQRKREQVIQLRYRLPFLKKKKE